MTPVRALLFTGIVHHERGAHDEGVVLGALGEVLAQQGRREEAHAAFDVGQGLLRELGVQQALAKLQCQRGRFDLAGGDRAAALAALA